MILQFVEAPKISQLLIDCFEDQEKYGDDNFRTTTKYLIQPSCPRGRQIIQGWEPHMEFEITRRKWADQTVYQFTIEVVWKGHPNGLSVFTYEPEAGDVDIYDLDFSVLETMPRVISDPPDYFVGHVFDVELREFCTIACLYRDSCYSPNPCALVTQNSFSAEAMLDTLT